MADEALTLDKLQAMITRGPYHQWLGLKVNSFGEGTIEVIATWREEFVVNPERRYTHGGILAALVDLAADWAIATKLGRPFPTVDMRVDYHRAAMPGNLTARGRIVKLGSTFTVAEGEVLDQGGAPVASGRGTYYTAPPKS